MENASAEIAASAANTWVGAKLVIGGVVIAVIALLWTGARWLERQLLYFPDTSRIAPAQVGLEGVRERIIAAADGRELVAWYAPAKPGQPTLLYFHGNGGHLAGRSERILTYTASGLGFLIMAYRGYSGSEGHPSEAANVKDARTVYETLRAEGVAAKDIFLYGESLGTGVAVQLAAQVPVGGIVLDSPYTSIVDVGAQAYPFLPVRLLMRDRYETVRFIGKIKVPVLILHGARDDVVPVEMGRKLYALLKGPKDIVIYPDAGHVLHAQFGSMKTVREWIAKAHETSGTRAATPQPAK